MSLQKYLTFSVFYTSINKANHHVFSQLKKVVTIFNGNWLILFSHWQGFFLFPSVQNWIGSINLKAKSKSTCGMLTYAREASAATQAVKSVQLDLHTTTLRKNLSTLHPTRNIKSLIDLCCVIVQSLFVKSFQLPSHLNVSSQIESIAPSFHSSTKALSAFQLLLTHIYTYMYAYRYSNWIRIKSLNPLFCSSL